MAVNVKRRSTERKRSQKSNTSWHLQPGIRGWSNEALGLFLLALGVFVSIAVLAFQAAKILPPGHFLEHTVLSTIDMIGVIGRSLGSGLSNILGLAAFVPLGWLIWLGYFFWSLDKSDEDDTRSFHWTSVLGIALLSIFLAAGLAGGLSGELGGAVGRAFSKPVTSLLGPLGAAVTMCALSIAAFSLATRQSSQSVIGSAFSTVRDIVVYGFIIGPLYILRYSYALIYTLVALVGSWFKRSATTDLQVKNRRIADGAPKQLSPRSTKKTLSSDDAFDLGLNSSNTTSEGLSSRIEKRVEASANVDLTNLDLTNETDTEEESSNSTPAVVKRRSVPVTKASKGGSKFIDEDEEPDFSGYKAPSFELMTKTEIESSGENDEELLHKSRQIEAKLKDFNILGRVTEVHPGPVITLFEFEPAPGVKVGKIAALQDDLAMSLKASSIRIIAPIPKKGTVGIEVPNRHRDMVRLRDVLEHPDFVANESILSVPLGKDTYGDPVYVDIAQMPHLLMAGATGTGKSVCINAVLVSLLYKASPEDLGLILIDPKVLELSIYEGIPHLKVPVVTIPRQAKAVLDWAAKEMDRRYRVMQKFGVRNIDGYNRIVAGKNEEKSETKAPAVTADPIITLSELDVHDEGTAQPDNEVKMESAANEGVRAVEELKPLPKIVIVIDELADLMLTVGREVEELITRLAQKARAAGIHLIVATQRPSVDVITGLIKANFPARISFRVTSRIDSRTILDGMGAERLLGRGDMLFLQPGSSHLRRVHGAFVSDNEVQKIVDSIKATAQPCYDQKILELCEKALAESNDNSEGTGGDLDEGEYDPLYDKAVELVVSKGHASTSMIQRVFRIGYNRAARIIEMMEREGVVGPMDGIKPREVLVQQIAPENS